MSDSPMSNVMFTANELSQARDRITQLEAEVQALREENVRLTQNRDDALERIVQLEDEYKFTRAAIREGLTDEQNVAHPVTREKVLFIRQERHQLSADLNAAIKLLLTVSGFGLGGEPQTREGYAELELLQAEIEKFLKENVVESRTGDKHAND